MTVSELDPELYYKCTLVPELLAGRTVKLYDNSGDADINRISKLRNASKK